MDREVINDSKILTTGVQSTCMWSHVYGGVYRYVCILRSHIHIHIVGNTEGFRFDSPLTHSPTWRSDGYIFLLIFFSSIGYFLDILLKRGVDASSFFFSWKKKRLIKHRF